VGLEVGNWRSAENVIRMDMNDEVYETNHDI